MRKLSTLMKTLLVAVGLCAGTSSVFADETVLNPTGGVTTVNTGSTDVAYSTTATSWVINQGGLTSNNIGKYAGPYCLVKFDASSISGTITEAKLTFDYASAAYNTSYNVYLLGAADWDATTVVWTTLSSTAKSATSIASGTWSTKNTTGTINYDIKSSVSKSLMGIAICCNTARAQTISNIKLTITHTTSSVYTATFAENNGLNPQVTIYTDAGRTETISNGALLDGTTYYYTATQEGYEDYESSFTVDGSNPEISFTMTAKPSYTINAVSGGTTLVTIASGYASVSTAYSTYVSKYVLAPDGNYYVLDDGSNADLSGYSASYTMGNSGNEVKEINYTLASNVVFFSEWEKATQSISNAGYYSTYENASYSGGFLKAVQGNANRDLHQAFSIASTATYLIEMPYYNSNANTRQYVLYLDGTGEDNKLETKSISGNTGGLFSKEIELTAGSHTIYLKENGATLTPQFDYLKVTLVSVPVTIGAEGYSTFASSYPLDLTTANLPAGVTAYKASVSGNKVNFTAIDQTVAANTGFLLEGTAGATVNIPVAATGTAVDGNDFLVNDGGATFTADADYYYFGLMKDSDLEFGVFDPETVAIPADKAYLKVAKSNFGSTPSRLEVVFNEATGINEVNGSRFKVQGSEYYNLNGQRISQPTRGLYIMNGKKYVVK